MSQMASGTLFTVQVLRAGHILHLTGHVRPAPPRPAHRGRIGDDRDRPAPPRFTIRSAGPLPLAAGCPVSAPGGARSDAVWPIAGP